MIIFDMGNRVHWLLWALPGKFVKQYQILVDPLYHSYLFMSDIDVFVVVRTSKHCFRISSVNLITKEIRYESVKTVEICALYLTLQNLLNR